jgi:hypothetical protein
VNKAAPTTSRAPTLAADVVTGSSPKRLRRAVPTSSRRVLVCAARPGFAAREQITATLRRRMQGARDQSASGLTLRTLRGVSELGLDRGAKLAAPASPPATAYAKVARPIRRSGQFRHRALSVVRDNGIKYSGER